MELTHKLYAIRKTDSSAELGTLVVSGGFPGAIGDERTIVTSAQPNTSTPIQMNAGDIISIKAKIITRRMSGIIPIDKKGEQALMKCSSYETGQTAVCVAYTDDESSTLTYEATENCYVFLASYWSQDIEGGVFIIKKAPEITTIDEPIGFDSLQTKIDRNDYHGMGAEVSVGELEFYNAAANIIEAEYNYDLDTEVRYVIIDGTTSDVVYSGVLDLSTISINESDYKSVSVKVGEIGAKTTFNNRLDTDVDLETTTTIDGHFIEKPEWMNLHVPMKHLLYTNVLKQKNTLPAAARDAWGSGDLPVEDWLGTIILDNAPTNEYGKVNQDDCIFIKDEGFDDKFGLNTQSKINASVRVKVAWDSVSIVGSVSVYGRLALYNGDTQVAYVDLDLNNNNTEKTLVVNTTITNGTLRLRFRFWQTSNANNGQAIYTNLRIMLQADSVFKMTMYDTLEEGDPVYADMLPVHEALNVVAHSISENELNVKSEFYARQESQWESEEECGYGALKALTNGYKIRGLFTDEENSRNMPVSFKTLIDSLSALDCIGWGFSTEDGDLCVRVERWDWFYKDNVLLNLTDAAEVTTEIAPDLIPTELKIGYKKYATESQYNSIDSPHGKRTFTNAIKAVSKTITKECEFVADNYAIEETRRAKSQVNETEETTYDEEIFVFELLRTSRNGNVTYSIGHTATEAENVGKADEFINAKLTPRHMAARWRDYIFATNNESPFRFTSGEINYKSSFKVYPYFQSLAQRWSITSLYPYSITAPQAENDDITYTHAKFQAEFIKFSYPLTIAQYKSVLANPYALICVNGKYGWIKNFTYSFSDGMADFTLIAKHEENSSDSD